MKNARSATLAALLTALLLATAFAAAAQQTPAQRPPAQPMVLARIAAATPPDQAVAPLVYLASDRFKGRYIGTPGIDSAALYIANQFSEAGARPVPGATGYFQVFTHHFSPNSLDSGSPAQDIRLRNVIAFIPGLDPQLRQQCIVLSSHYDHLGVTKHPQMEEGKLDSIYNGARDNASGTTAVIDAARYFGKHPAKRSILFICYTAEEEGLIGSEWYAAHPLIPLSKTVYNLNIDNASYDDTSLVTLVGLNRTTGDTAVLAAAAAYGLTVNDDPTGGSLFFESDNAPLALRGVPAPTYSMGMRAMDSTIFNRYHRFSDETGNMDMHYVVKWIRTYILAARTIADELAQPRWTPGDIYEKTWEALYSNQK
jgi:Zn-dependent M28 family amino/carboxypeptidase